MSPENPSSGASDEASDLESRPNWIAILVGVILVLGAAVFWWRAPDARTTTCRAIAEWTRERGPGDVGDRDRDRRLFQKGLNSSPTASHRCPAAIKGDRAAARSAPTKIRLRSSTRLSTQRPGLLAGGIAAFGVLIGLLGLYRGSIESLGVGPFNIALRQRRVRRQVREELTTAGFPPEAIQPAVELGAQVVTSKPRSAATEAVRWAKVAREAVDEQGQELDQEVRTKALKAALEQLLSSPPTDPATEDDAIQTAVENGLRQATEA